MFFKQNGKNIRLSINNNGDIMKVAFYDAKPYDIKFFDKENNSFNYYIKYFDYKLSVDTAALSKGFDVVCVFVNDNISNEVIDILYQNGVKLIALRCAGYNNVDFKAAYGKIHVVRVPAYSPYAVAEHALSLIMTLNRKIHKAYNRTRDNNFNINGLIGFDLHGKTVGVIGTGKIGQVFSNIANGVGMKVLAYDLYPNNDLGLKYVDLETLFKNSDIISLHCPLTTETYHIIDNNSINKMKDGVMIINTSRGGLINTESLIEGLKIQKVSAAGLDVYEEEGEYFFEDFSNDVISDDVLARLLSFTNVIVTSHQAFFTKEALANIANTTLENINSFEKGKSLENEICYQCSKNGSCAKREGKNCF